MTKSTDNQLRWRHEREKCLRAAKDYKVLSITLSEVMFRYNGIKISFKPYEHTVTMSAEQPHMPWMPPEDHAFLFSQAKELLIAYGKGVRLAQQKKVKKKPTKKVTPFTDTRQISVPL